MGYIQSKEHFRNYIQKALDSCDSSLLENVSLMPIGQYVHTAYEFRDSFAWAIKNDIGLLCEDAFWKWIGEKRSGGVSIPAEIDNILSEDFIEACDSLVGLPGVYSFWSRNGICLYVGMSTDLGSRIVTSFRERFCYYSNLVFLKYFQTRTSSDAALLETALITKIKPILNTTSKFLDELTMDFDLPELSKPIACNQHGEKIYIKYGSRYKIKLSGRDNEGLEDVPQDMYYTVNDPDEALSGHEH